MMRIPMSPAASALLRALLVRANTSRDRILLTDYRSTDWQSLTFVGERHRLGLRITGADAANVAQVMTHELEDAEFAIARHIVADIALHAPPRNDKDGSVIFEIDALTIEE